MKYFTGIKTIEELRQRYRELLKKYHPDNEGGSVEITQEINAEYDRLFSILSEEKQTDKESTNYDYQAENDAFKRVINKIIHINSDVEIIGSWIWVHSGYEYRELLKNVGLSMRHGRNAGAGILGIMYGIIKARFLLRKSGRSTVLRKSTTNQNSTQSAKKGCGVL